MQLMDAEEEWVDINEFEFYILLVILMVKVEII